MSHVVWQCVTNVLHEPSASIWREKMEIKGYLDDKGSRFF
jgi:hypothetical protein